MWGPQGSLLPCSPARERGLGLCAQRLPPRLPWLQEESLRSECLDVSFGPISIPLFTPSAASES